MPGRPEFEAAGLGALYRAIPCHGGLAHWAEHFGFEYRVRGNDRWPKERIEREFHRCFKAPARFPMKKEFETAGQHKLWVAIRSHGGLDYWSERLGLQVAAGWLERKGA